MDFCVRTLQSGDVATLRGMLEVFGRAFEDIDRYCGNQPRESYLRKLIEGDTLIAIAALAGSKVIGALVAYELRKIEQEVSEIYIYDLAVEESHRRAGIATAMIEKLKLNAASRSASLIYVQADYGDEPSFA